MDLLIDCDDGTKAVVDCKTTEPRSVHLATYGRQLHAYATALEHPSAGRPETVSSLGLLCFVPDTFEAENSTATLSGDVHWVEVPQDDRGFVAFLGEVVAVLDEPEPPIAWEGCPWCAQRVSFHAVA